jgi:tetratricopeptide (TPR) repeat protein
MKLPFIVIFVLSLSCVTHGQIVLSGQVRTDDQPPKAVRQVRITAAGLGNTTDGQGKFRIQISSDLHEGDRVIIKVFRNGWIVNNPVDGSWNLPSIRLAEIQPLTVVIVPVGSPKLWSTARIKYHIAELIAETAKAKRDFQTLKDQQPAQADVDYGRYFKEWGERLGFTADEVKTTFDNWVKTVKNSNDAREKALRDFYEKNFREAAHGFEKAAVNEEDEIRRLQNEIALRESRAYDNWQQAGDSYSQVDDFQDAIEAYNNALKHVSKDKQPDKWAETLFSVGSSKELLARRTDGAVSKQLFIEALEAFNEARTITGVEDPFADLQISHVLREQGIRAIGDERIKLLSESVAKAKSASVIADKKFAKSYFWANIQSTLAQALLRVGDYTEGEQRDRLLEDAAAATRKSLTVFSRDRYPTAWSDSQHNLGVILRHQAELVDGEQRNRLLSEAITAYQQSLLVATRTAKPHDWALTQNAMGNALLSKGATTDGPDGVRDLRAAILIFKAALDVRTKLAFPQEWAETLTNLASAQMVLAERLDEPDRKPLPSVNS